MRQVKRQPLKIRAVESMGGGCQCCGYDRTVHALHFHHLDPTTKEFNLSKAFSKGLSPTGIAEELRKCILLCSNCHSEIHAGIIEIPETYASLNEEIWFAT